MKEDIKKVPQQADITCNESEYKDVEQLLFNYRNRGHQHKLDSQRSRALQQAAAGSELISERTDDDKLSELEQLQHISRKIA